MLEKFYIFTLKYPGKESGPAFFVSFARFCSGALRYGDCLLYTSDAADD